MGPFFLQVNQTDFALCSFSCFDPCQNRIWSIDSSLSSRFTSARSDSRRWRLASCTRLWSSWATRTIRRPWTSFPSFGLYRFVSPLGLPSTKLKHFSTPSLNREVVEKFPNLRASIVEKLLETFGDIKSGKVFRGALWIAGEYCVDPQGRFFQ